MKKFFALIVISSLSSYTYTMNYDLLKQKTQIVIQALLRIQPTIEQLAYGRIEALRKSLTSGEWKKIISDLKSYISILSMDLPELLKTLPAEVSTKEVQEKIVLFDKLPEELEKLVPTDTKKINETIRSLEDDITYLAMQQELQAYYKKSLEPLFRQLSDPNIINIINSMLDYLKKGKEKDIEEDIEVVKQLPQFLAFVDTVFGLLGGTAEFCLIAITTIKQLNLQVPKESVKKLESIVWTSYTIQVKLTEKINGIISETSEKLNNIPTFLRKLMKIDIKLDLKPLPKKPALSQGEYKKEAAITEE